ncbi:MAG: penicillin acylase family protein, partial [Myxococcota bacterium]
LSTEERALLDSFSAGINQYLAELRAGDAIIPGPVFNLLLDPGLLEDWTPVDSIAIARFQSASLSRSTGDLGRTAALERWLTNFSAEDEDGRRAALAGAYHDLYSFRPARFASNLDGFPNTPTDEGTSAFRLPRGPQPVMRFPSADTVRGGLRALEALERQHELLGDSFRGSNSWAVGGDLSASGNAIMANDPHLSLTAPPLFWQAHINTKAAGGDLNVAGQMIAGTPGSILAWTDDIAWGLTTTGYDTTDLYLETITPGEDGAPDTVLFNGAQVAIEVVDEPLRNASGDVVEEYQVEIVPHHGPILPGSRNEDGTEAISIRWTGDQPTNETGAFFALYTATTIDEVRQAFRRFEVGNQTLMVALRNGETFYTSSAIIPQRPPAARTYDPANNTGVAPCFVLDGTGSMEWSENDDGTIDGLDERFIPHAENDARGWIATANADATGATNDGDPLNDPYYLGCTFADGYRLGRVQEELERLAMAGDITPEMMSTLQNDAQSPLGRYAGPVWAQELRRAVEEDATPGTHPDLSDAVEAVGDAAMGRMADVASRLEAWGARGWDADDGLVGDKTADEVADSIAAAIFNVSFGRVMRLTFDDEFDVALDGACDGELSRTGAAMVTMHHLVTDPSVLASGERLWDDICSEGVESRGDRILRGVADALAWLDANLGADPSGWQWGRLHTLTLEPLLADPTGMGRTSIPPGTDPEFAGGFPRQGDRGVVDAASFSPFALDDFSYGSGPQQRLVVEITPDGPEAVNSFPGGASEDVTSPFFANEMETWRVNAVEPVPYTQAEIVEAVSSVTRFSPGS